MSKINSINAPNTLVQFKYATSTTALDSASTIPYDDTIPQKTEGFEVITVSITPQKTTNLLKIDFYTTFDVADVSGNIISTAALFQDDTADALAATSNSDTAAFSSYASLVYIMAAGTTSSTTFKIRMGKALGNTKTNNLYGGVSTSILRVWEFDYV